MSDLDQIFSEAWDRICKEAGPMSEPARRRIISAVDKRKPQSQPVARAA